MLRKLTCLSWFAVLLSMALMSTANADLVGWWKLDELSGTIAADSSGLGNNGTLEGDPQWVTGYFDGALDLDGTDDYIDLAPVGTLIGSLTDCSFATWVDFDNAGGPWQRIFEFSINGNVNMFLVSRIYTSGPMRFGITISGNTNEELSTTADTLPSGWHHVAVTIDEIVDGQVIHTLYLDGEVVADNPNATLTPSDMGTETTLNWLGRPRWINDGYFNGRIDDFRIYDQALNQEGIQIVMYGGEDYPYASSPVPADNTIYLDTSVTLSWSPGYYAISHDVYFGTDFDDVNEGLADTLQGNQTETFLVIPDLVPGMPYYWRIDEVNTENPDSPWKGPVWSFTIPPRQAHNPIPANGAGFIDPNVILSWTAGLGAQSHTVYFGGDFDNVQNATGGTAQTETTYTPPGRPLELKKIYYWRVDESDGQTTYKGDVWQFTVGGAGGGLRGNYYEGLNFDTLILSRIDRQINFDWTEETPVEPPFTVRWVGEITVPFTETYTFYTFCAGGTRLWINGELLIDDWNPHSAYEYKNDIDLEAGVKYSFMMEYLEEWDTEGRPALASAELRWESPRTPKQLIPSDALSPPLMASRPNPSTGAVNVKYTQILTWDAGEHAASHQIYVGTNEDAVKNATTASIEYKGIRDLGSENFDPGKLGLNTTYYWRVDEVNNLNPDSPWLGNVWSFTTANYLVVDDFESYNDLDIDQEGSNRIYMTWIDGFDNPSVNGSIMGYPEPSFPDGEHFVETEIFHGGSQSTPIFFNNTIASYSEVKVNTNDLPIGPNWTFGSPKTLSLWIYGDPNNPVTEQMYVKLENSKKVYTGDLIQATWQEWNVSLSSFGLPLYNVTSLSIGFERTGATGGSGMVFIDDIRLYP